MWLHSTTCGYSTLYSSQVTDGLVIGLQSANPYGLITTWHCGEMTGMALDMYNVPQPHPPSGPVYRTWWRLGVPRMLPLPHAGRHHHPAIIHLGTNINILWITRLVAPGQALAIYSI